MFCGIVFCSDGCRNGHAPCTHWYWQRQEQSALCPWSEKTVGGGVPGWTLVAVLHLSR